MYMLRRVEMGRHIFWPNEDSYPTWPGPVGVMHLEVVLAMQDRPWKVLDSDVRVLWS